MHSSAMMEDVQVCGLLQRIIEFEESDSETIHLLVFLLMQFMSRPDQVKQSRLILAWLYLCKFSQAFPTDDKNMAKMQNIVLRHMYLLLGYNWSERGFYVSAQKLR